MIYHFQYNIRHANINPPVERFLNDNFTVVIKTCWRLEIYRGSGWVNEETVRHLYRVVAGLDSPVLGDGAIQNQVKKAYLQACQQKKLDKFMHRLFQSALHIGKLVRNHTNITRGAVSYANAMYNIVAHRERLPLATPIVVVGVNEITRNVCRFLLKKGYNRLTLFNRSITRAETLGKELQIAYGPLTELPDALKHAYVLIAAAAAPESIIGAAHFTEKGYLIIDVGVPPNVDQKVHGKSDVIYYGIDAIEHQINQNFSFRQKESDEALRIINAQVMEFMRWQQTELNRTSHAVAHLSANSLY